ncbi:MAG: cyclic 2,3-diphosphoglycerate synthase [Ignavibacteria bacterium]|nr:cyclic 2,3-diphosphoglycerate synthase [Ignavibacteria bacterium]MDH7527644.1 cyclic 2,3-diphosphoglycerate synthase [Ignavibacteria bacterium]
MTRKRVIIMGAAGRDFHNFNVFYRNKEEYEVVAFTATQIPNIDGRIYPPELAGKLYPNGIPIFHENELTDLIKKYKVDEVVFAYSDVTFEHVMTKASEANAAGANFVLLGVEQTMLKSSKPVVAVLAVRTGCGKSQTSRYVANLLKQAGKKVAAIRHPMPYGDLNAQRVQRFATLEDLHKYNCTIEEMEEYEPHIVNGTIVYAGVDYEDILRQAEQEVDVILWDGGNNDTPFFKPDLVITVTDPLRPGHELRYYPGNTSLRIADIAIINKISSAKKEDIETVRKNIKQVNPKAVIIEADSPIEVEDPELIKGKRVLVVEDGPTLTHGEMKFGAGVVASLNNGAKELVDPRPFAVESIQETYRNYPEIGTLLPAMGYGKKQMKDLEETINRTDCDVVVIGTPIDLRRVININKPATRVRYYLKELTKPGIEDILREKGII